ncbi:hypothetical protein LTR62_000243 [Meristemomyces frigidus]|uniref:Uncharacterized protein n=1 Tax=Meristemomyces frigidus TaxID=1508187 RepID=A0AAN7YL53_9PEZI|nr:hypothetical protein LTR62_000243 [Meristemomyces frigidus]
MSTSTTTLSAQVDKLNISDDSSQSADGERSELVAVVDDLLTQLSSKFNNLSSELIGKSKPFPLDEMSRRLDILEANIQAGNAQSQAGGDA